jgi:hypothetical protein
MKKVTLDGLFEELENISEISHRTIHLTDREMLYAVKAHKTGLSLRQIAENLTNSWKGEINPLTGKPKQIKTSCLGERLREYEKNEKDRTTTTDDNLLSMPRQSDKATGTG